MRSQNVTGEIRNVLYGDRKKLARSTAYIIDLLIM